MSEHSNREERRICMTANWKELLGHRVLVKNEVIMATGRLEERIVNEVSASGNVRLDDYWANPDFYELVEDLGLSPA